MADDETIACVVCGAQTLSAEASMSAHGLMCGTCHVAETQADAAQMQAQVRGAESAVLGLAGGAALGAVGIGVVSGRGLGQEAAQPRRSPVIVRPPRADKPWYAVSAVLRFVDDGLSILEFDDSGAEVEPVIYALSTLNGARQSGRADVVLTFDSGRVHVTGMGGVDAFLAELGKRAPELESYEEPTGIKEAFGVPVGVASVFLLSGLALHLIPNELPPAPLVAVPVLFALSLGWVGLRWVRRPTRTALRR